MKNYWLDRRPSKNHSAIAVASEKRWKRLEICSTSCFLLMKDDNMDKVPDWSKALESFDFGEPTGGSWQNDGWGE